MPRVEANAVVHPPFVRTDRVEKLLRIVVGVVVPEGVLGVAVEVLAVEECDGALDGGLSGHGVSTNQ